MNSSQHNQQKSQPQQPVLVLGEYGVLNGGERSFLTVAKHLIARGWNYVAAVPRDSPFESALQTIGIRNVGLSTHAANETRFSQTELRDQIADLVKAVQPCLLHANSLSVSRLVGPLDVGVPSVGYLRDILKLSKKATSDINQNDRVIAVSDATARWHVDQGLDADRVVTIYNGVDTQMFCPLESCAISDSGDVPMEATVLDRLQSEFNFSSDASVLLYVGQIGMRKGISDLAEIFLRAIQKIPSLKLLIVGERNSAKAEAIVYEQEIRKRLSLPSIDQSVKWLGRREDVADLMRFADILVHPARQEPLGRVLLEALASALPIVTTSVGGSPEILSGALSANNLFPVGEAEQIAKRISQLSKDDQLRRRIGREQRDIAHQRFSIRQCEDSLAETYLSVLDKSSRETRAVE